jgi:putative oxidoreductase
MNKYISQITSMASMETIDRALLLMRVGIGVLTIGHGIPKIMGGVPMWQELGTWVYPLGIHFLPTMWGFLGACTEFFGGIALVAGFGTRVASFCLTMMMFVATVWHLNHGDVFNVYSFPLSLIVVYIGFIMMGSGKYSADAYLFAEKTSWWK